MQDHRNIASRIGSWSAAHRKTAILGWLAFVVLTVGLIMGGGMIKTQHLTSAEEIAGNAGEAEQMLEDSGLSPTEEIVLIQSASSTTDDPEFQALIAETERTLTETKHVEHVQSPLNSEGGSISEDGHSAFVQFEVEGGEKNVDANLEASQTTVTGLQDSNPEFSVAQFGGGSANQAINETLGSDVGKAGMLSLPITLLILLVALGALVAASVPLALALTSVIATMALVAIPSQMFALGGNVEALILLIGLAVGVDYSLFFMRREREERAAGRTNRDAIEAAAATSGRAVMISGLTVIIAMAGMLMTGDATFESFAVATVTVVAVSMLATLAVLPAVLSWLGDRIEKGRVPFTRRLRGPVRESRIWGSIVTRVMRRPVVSLVVAGGLLLALAIPALSMNVVQTGSEDLPKDLPVMQTYDDFTTRSRRRPTRRTSWSSPMTCEGARSAVAIDDLLKRAEASDVINGKVEIDYSDDNTVAKITIPTIGDGTGDQSVRALDEVRDVLVPATVGRVAEANVTGGTAQSEDYKQLLSERMPLVFLFVLGMAFLLLLVTFRSIVIPIKAIILNLLSVGAAYGVLVLVFQNGAGESLLGFESNGGVTNWLPCSCS